MTGKRKNQTLQTQTDLLATVFESSPNILMLVNADLRLEMINRVGSEFVDSTQEELIGLLGGEVVQCIHAFDGMNCGRSPECDDCPVRTRVLRSFQKGERILSEEGRLMVRGKTGEFPMDFLISTVPVEIADEVKVLVTIVDITQRKRVEDALQESEERYRQAVENSPNPIFSIDREGIIQTWNRACEKTFLYDHAILGQHYQTLLRNAEDRSHVETMLAHMLKRC